MRYLTKGQKKKILRTIEEKRSVFDSKERVDYRLGLRELFCYCSYQGIPLEEFLSIVKSERKTHRKLTVAARKNLGVMEKHEYRKMLQQENNRA